MPSKFGSVSKAYVVPDDQLSQSSFISSRVPNPLALNPPPPTNGSSYVAVLVSIIHGSSASKILR